MQREIERRTYGAKLRAKAEEGEAEPSMLIEGYAAVFDSPSEDLGFREIIAPTAFDRALEEEHDVRALWNHNSDLVLGRTKSGTLRLAVDEQGLRIENDLPDTQAGRDARVSIMRGDVDQMSFAFVVPLGGDKWEEDENGGQTRTLLDVDLLDVSPVAYPAYPQTQVSARALEVLRALAEAGKRRAPAGGTVNAARLRLARR